MATSASACKMQEDAHPININLQIVDPQYNILKQFDFTVNEKWLTFMNIIIITKRFFFEKYNKYLDFGSCNFSSFTFHDFKIISCNGTNIGNLSKLLPNGPVCIHIQAKGMAKKVPNLFQKKCFDKKFDNLTHPYDLVKMRQSIREKNRRNKMQKLRAKFGDSYSIKTFNKKKKEKNMNNSKNVKEFC